jgi:hypothetical protein
VKNNSQRSIIQAVLLAVAAKDAGLSLFFRQFFDRSRKFSLNETLSGGLLIYRIEEQNSYFVPYYGGGYLYHFPPFQKINQNTFITGNTFGATVGISAEYKVLPYLSVGIGGSFMYGNFGNATCSILV